MIRRIRRVAGGLRVSLAGPLAALGLIAAAGLADGAWNPDGPGFSPEIAEAAPAADVSRFRPAQATTSTATPLIRLTPDTPTPFGGGAGGTATSEAGTVSPRGTSTGTTDPAVTPEGTGGPGGATPGATDGSGGAGTPSDPGSGAAPGSGPEGSEPRPDATSAALGTAAVPAGTSALGTDADADPPASHPFATAELGDFSAPPGSAGTAGVLRDAPFQRSVGPFGVAVDVDDPAAAALWRQRGSPRADQSWADRLAANRPRPWGWWGFYPIAGLLFAVAAWRVVAGIRSGDGA